MENNSVLNEDNNQHTPQELIDKTIATVKALLDKYYPEHLNFGNGSYTISHGSTQVMVIVRPFTNDDTCVEFISNVVTGAKITPELMKFLLRKNAELHFGAFGLLFDDTVSFTYMLAGMNLDDNEFKAALDSVATISDYYDDYIVEMSGGKRAKDIVEVEE